MSGDTWRRALEPIKAVRRQRDELEHARAELAELRQELSATQQQLERATKELSDAQTNRDPRAGAESVERVIDRVCDRHADAPERPVLRDLALAAGDLDTNRMVGHVVVVGRRVDAPALVLAAAKGGDRPMTVFVDPPHGFDLTEDDNAWAEVGVTPAAAGLQVVVGSAADTIDLDEPVALAHLDGAGYDQTLVAVERIAPLLVSGGRIVLGSNDDAAGGRAALDRYLRDRAMDFRFERHCRLHVVRR